MILVERKEALDALLQQILGLLDVQFYGPLNEFIGFSEHISPYIAPLKRIQRSFRRYFAKKHLNTTLFQFYSRDLINVTYRLVSQNLLQSLSDLSLFNAIH